MVRTSARRVKGKPAYLAPEAIEGKAIDARVDIFSLGVVLHEMLTLENLFGGDDDLITIRKTLTMPIDPPSRDRADVPPALDAIVLKALSRDLAGRYATAGEMANDLNEMVLASGLRPGEVVAFIREAMREDPGATGATPAWHAEPTTSADTMILRPGRADVALAPGARNRLRSSRFGRWLFGRHRQPG